MTQPCPLLHDNCTVIDIGIDYDDEILLKVKYFSNGFEDWKDERQVEISNVELQQLAKSLGFKDMLIASLH